MRTTWYSLLRTVLLAPTVAVLAGCLAPSGGSFARGTARASGGGTLGAQCRGDFGATAAAQKVESFLAAAADFSDAALQVQNDLYAACQRMGRSLGMVEADLTGAGVEGMRVVCGRVHDRFRAELDAVRAATQLRVTVESSPPRCEVSMDAYTRCAAECEAQVDPGAIELQCEGGELRGRCDAQCTGRCAVDVSGQCGGVCEGICEGGCAQTGPDGSCAGACEGSCRGKCVAQASASCQGECRGGCSVEYREPYCTGRVRPAQVSARCRASCEARVEARARCTPGQARMSVAGGVDPEMRPRIEALQAAVRDGLGSILALRTRVERLQRAGVEIARIAPELPNAAATAGIGAIACAGAAGSSIAQSMASVSVSVEVSVSISASASASMR